MRDLIQATAERMANIKAELEKKIGDSGLGYYVPTSLLGSASTKTIKGQKYGWTTYVLYMSPYRLNSKGLNLCPKATPGCVKSCLFTSGRGSFQSVEVARFNKAEFFVLDRQKFMDKLVKDIQTIVNRHDKLTEQGTKKYTKKFAIRLNGTSDIDWELINIDSQGGKNIFEVFPNVQFYDYTKIASRMQRAKVHPNYFVTFSVSEHNSKVAEKILNDGNTIAKVYFPSIPKTDFSHEVFDGDESDLVFTYQEVKNASSIVIGLYLKVPKKTKEEVSKFIRESLKSGFVHIVDNDRVIPTTDENIENAISNFLGGKSPKKSKLELV